MDLKQTYNTEAFESSDAITKLPNKLFLFLFIGTLFLASSIIILLFNLLGISISTIVNNLPIAFLVGLVGGPLWISLLFSSIFLIERFRKELIKRREGKRMLKRDEELI